jgi:ubiquinone biosynthesis accessory factor UbiJ
MSSTFDYVLQAPWKRFINHVLRATPRAMERLQAFAGKTVVFRSGLFKLGLTVLANGEVDVAAQEAAADVTMVVSPALLPRLAAQDESAFKEAAFEGDVDFAQEIGFLARNLKWDIEEDLSKVVGDIVAHRVVSAARAADEWRRDATRRLGENIKEYLTEERPALVARRHIDEFVREVDATRDDVARLEKRLKRLERPSK